MCIFEDSFPFHVWYESQTDLTAITDPVLFQDIPVQGNCNNGKWIGSTYIIHVLYMLHVQCNFPVVDYHNYGNGMEPLYVLIIYCTCISDL